MIYFFVSDLIFKSKIREAIPSAAFLKDSIVPEDASTVVVDLQYKKEDAVTLIRALRSAYPAVPILAYGSHVAVELMQSARDAGAEVLPNSGFVKWLGSHGSSNPQQGAGVLTLLVFGLLLWGAVWYTFHLVPIYYRYYELDHAMQSLVRVAPELKDKEVRNRMLAHMRSIGTPGDIKSVQIDRIGQGIQVQYEYGEDIVLELAGTSYLLQEFYFVLNHSTDSP